MFHARTLRILLISGTALAIASRLCNGADHQAHEPRFRLSRAQIIHRSAPICAALSPDSNVPVITASAVESGRMNGEHAAVWLVDAADPQESYQIHLVWNGDTGELMSASRSVPVVQSRKNSGICRAEAVRISRSWLTSLGVQDSAIPDCAPAVTCHNRFIWRFEWADSRRYTSVTINSSTGDLVIAESFGKRVARG